jgi:hypothetical protein
MHPNNLLYLNILPLPLQIVSIIRLSGIQELFHLLGSLIYLWSGDVSPKTLLLASQMTLHVHDL